MIRFQLRFQIFRRCKILLGLWHTVIRLVPKAVLKSLSRRGLSQVIFASNVDH